MNIKLYIKISKQMWPDGWMARWPGGWVARWVARWRGGQMTGKLLKAGKKKPFFFYKSNPARAIYFDL